MMPLLTPQLSSLQCKRRCNSVTADILQKSCCGRMLASTMLLAVLILDKKMLQSNTLQPNMLKSSMPQLNRLHSNVLEWVNIASHAHQEL